MDSVSHPTRRQWVKQFVFGTATTLVGLRLTGTVCAEIVPAINHAVIRLKVADITMLMPDDTGALQPFPVLSQAGGSIQYQFNTGVPPFTLTRVEVNRFVTLDSVCKHNGCTVGRYTRYQVGENTDVQPPTPIYANYMYCRCHGSRYDIEGRVFRNTNGVSTEPAKADLNRFETSYDPATDIVSISIPNLALRIQSTSVQQKGLAGKVRLKLEFPVTAFSEYEIYQQNDLTPPGTRVPFSLTPEGVANQMSLSTLSDQVKSVYVDSEGPTGFFVVGLVLTPVPY